MADSTKLNKDGLNKVWLKVMELIQSLTGNVDRTKGTLQEQIDKLDGNLTANYPLKTQISNPNLLDNPWFTVNQRGQSNYIELGYALDRWIVNNSSTVIELQENGIIVSNKDEGTINLTQWLSDDLTKDLFGKEVTLSIKLIDGTILSTSFRIPEIISNIIYGYIHIKNELYLAITGNTEANKNAVFLYTGTTDSDSISIQAIKLELGSISTLANDVAPNYQQELAKCQRYYQLIKVHSQYYYPTACFSPTEMRMGIDLSVPMVRKPDVSFSDFSAIEIFGNGSALKPSEFSVGVYNMDTHLVLVFVVDNGTANSSYLTKINTSMYLSADL